MSNQTKAERREAARAEALALQKKQQGRERMYRIAILSVLGVLIVGLGVAIWLIFAESQKSAIERADTVPAGVIDGTGIPVDEKGAAGTLVEDAPRLDVYVDFMCPVCGQFEQLNGADISKAREAGDVAFVVHPVGILDHLSQGTDYSTRAAASVAWVADQAPESFIEYHDVLFANQPAENSPGHSDEQLATFAEQAGVPADVAEGISDGTAADTFSDWVLKSTDTVTSDQALANPETGQFGTPTVMLEDERFPDWGTPGALTAAITAAGGGDSGAESEDGASEEDASDENASDENASDEDATDEKASDEDATEEDASAEE